MKQKVKVEKDYEYQNDILTNLTFYAVKDRFEMPSVPFEVQVKGFEIFSQPFEIEIKEFTALPDKEPDEIDNTFTF